MNSGVLLLMYWMIVYESLNVKASLSWFLSKMMTIWCSSSYKYKYCILLAADISQCFKYLNVEKVQFGEAKLILNFYTTATLFQTPPLHLKKKADCFLAYKLCMMVVRRYNLMLHMNNMGKLNWFFSHF